MTRNREDYDAAAEAVANGTETDEQRRMNDKVDGQAKWGNPLAQNARDAKAAAPKK